MKKYFLQVIIFLAILFSMKCFGQSGQWVWMRGDTTYNGYGVGGLLGTEDTTYNPPALYLASGWTDNQGRLWLFGGQTYDPGYYPYYIPYPECFDRIWRYDPATNIWKYVNGSMYANGFGVYGTMGVPDSSNHPGGRIGAAIWKDNTGAVWLFGGDDPGFIAMYNDLWKYDMDANTWTWIRGPNTYNVSGVYGTKGVESPNNNPPTRREAAVWVDADNNLWMFGGYHNDLFTSVFYNDLWKYNIADNQWTWMGGSNLPDQLGNYGTMGIGDTNNIPRSRSCTCSWSDDNGNFYLYGGNTQTLRVYILGDVWKFNLLTKQWTWLSGQNQFFEVNNPGISNYDCTFSSSAFPVTRMESSCLKLDSSKILLFGGLVSWSDGNRSIARDVWIYNYSSNEWSKVWADSSTYEGNYGTQGVYDSLNDPRSRHGAVSWKGSNGVFWVYGGNNCIDDCAESDLWKYTIDTACITIIPTLVSEVSTLKFEIIPNPASDFFQLTVNTIPVTNSELTIYNLLHQKIFRMDIGGKEKIRVDVENFNRGIYIVEVNSSQQRWVSKLIKE